MNYNHLSYTISSLLSVLNQHTLKECRPGYNALSFPSETISQAFDKFQATLSFELKSKLNGRLERGLAIARSNGVTPYADPGNPQSTNLYKVRSSNPLQSPYLVDLHNRSCTCPDHWKGHFCKHRIAANIITIAAQLSKVNNAPAPVVQEIEQPIKVEPKPVPSPQPTPKKDAIVWGTLRLNGQLLGVELLNMIEGDKVVVRALPKVIEGNKLRPQFPFSGQCCTTTVRKDELFNVKVFQHADA
jgi:hypothetical protein